MSDLSIEQQFELAKVKSMIADASLDQMKSLFIDLYASTLRKDNITKELLAHQWGLDNETVDPTSDVKRWIDCGE